MNIVKRNGNVVKFEKQKITIAVLSALNETKEGGYGDALKISDLVHSILTNLNEITVESVQDTVEKVLMQEGYFDTSKAYILYRENRKQDRERVFKI